MQQTFPPCPLQTPPPGQDPDDVDAFAFATGLTGGFVESEIGRVEEKGTCEVEVVGGWEVEIEALEDELASGFNCHSDGEFLPESGLFGSEIESAARLCVDGSVEAKAGFVSGEVGVIGRDCRRA